MLKLLLSLVWQESYKKLTYQKLKCPSHKASDAQFLSVLHSKFGKTEIFWLPTYSPKLNLIEILWKFIKYEWIEIDAYENWNSLIKYLNKVLENVGKEYVINFV